MIKRIKLPGWILIVLLIVGVIIGMNQLLTKVLAESSGSNDQDRNVVDSSIYPGLNIKTETKETDLYTLSVSQPYTDNEKINTPINDWIDAEKDAFTSGVETSKNMLEENGFRAHLNIQVDTKKIADKVYTIEAQSYQITGGANGMTTVKSFVVDLHEATHLQLEDVFQTDEHALDAMKELIIEALHSDADVSPYLFDDMVEQALIHPDQWKWSISQDDVTFYFDQYEIAAGAAGTVKVNIPMKLIKPHLDEDFASRIDVEVTETEQVAAPHSVDMDTLDPDGKYIALTFDDGPHPEVTPRILDTLSDHNAKATFYMLGSQVEYYPALAKQVAEAEHEIGNHTMNHQDLSLLGLEHIQEEIQQSNDMIAKATGRTPTTLRPPYGASNSSVEQITSDLGYSLIMWSVDSLDWKNRNAAAVHETVMSNVAPGSIVLLHDIHPSTADALPELLSALEEQGYQMVTVSQLLEWRGETGVGPYYGG